jgi:hypothetical protein
VIPAKLRSTNIFVLVNIRGSAYLAVPSTPSFSHSSKARERSKHSKTKWRPLLMLIQWPRLHRSELFEGKLRINKQRARPRLAKLIKQRKR